jgi:ABC-type antimicrobial peptide transport system permease subunit
MLLLLATAVLAAALAAVAIYGSIWYSVTQRVPEIGIRLALGASRRAVCGSVIGKAMLTTAIGCAAGIAAAVAARPALAGLLFQTPATDVRTYTAVLGVVLALTLIAAIGPAIRAMRVDPVIALRDE